MGFTQRANVLGRKQRENLQESKADSEGMALLELPVDSIRPNPYQPRTRFDQDALAELADSIREQGLIQPLTVRKTARGYELIAGERRLRACKLLGHATVPCIVRECQGDTDSALMALIENVQRRDLDFLEEAECYRAVLHTYRMTQEQLAKKMGKSQSFLANKLRLLQLPPCVRRAMKGGGLTERHARALLRLPNQEAQMSALAEIMERQMNVKDSERLIERMIKKNQEGQNHKPKRIRLLRDYRLFVNAVKCGADQLRETGLSVELVQTDQENGVDVLVRIRKPGVSRPEAAREWPMSAAGGND